MNGENNTVPFGVPPAGFIQTGNQAFEAPSSFDQPSDFHMNEPVMNATEFQTPAGGSDVPFSPFENPFSSTAAEQDTATQVQTGQKYNIVDLFWLINPKFYIKQQPVQGEAHFVIISFNVDFGNLRVSLFNLTNNSIQGNIVYLENLKRLVAGTIYPATAFNVYHSPRVRLTCLEQLFRQIPGAQWQQGRPVCTVEKNQEKIRFSVRDPKVGTYFYDFVSWHREAFLHACLFCITDGFKLVAQQHIRNNRT